MLTFYHTIPTDKNNVGKRENDGNQDFLPFLQYFEEEFEPF